MSEQRLSVTFGAFSCDVVGYDDPFSILNRVVELFGEIARNNPAFGAGEVGMSDMERAKLAARLNNQASRIEELADSSAPHGRRYVVSNAEADLLDPPGEAAPDQAAEEEVVIAAEASDDATGGDLELRDTLEAVDAPAPVNEDEVVALEIDAAAAELNVLSQDAGAAIEAAAEPVAALDGPAPSEETALASETAEVEAAEVETVQIADIAEIAEPVIEAPKDEAPIVDAPAAAENTAAETPAEEPLRLNIGDSGLEPTPGAAPKSEDDADAAAKAPADEPEKRQRRVTVTKLPLRPDPAEAKDPSSEAPKHILTPVQKVEPVVTLNTTIADPAVEPAAPTRAERIKAKMDQREEEDDGENFLFADVAEPQAEIAVDPGAAPTAEPQLTLRAPSPDNAPAPTTPDETAKKPRRSLVSMLGFGKKPEPTPETPSVADISAPVETPPATGSSDADGFDRLRESVAAAMPATDQPLAAPPKMAAEPLTISEAIDYDEESSPTAFARTVGATTLQDLLEASAAYIDIVEGKSRFSRRDVMQALHQIDADKDYTQEARLKSFRKLLTTGSLVRVDDGLFTVSQATRFGYESQLQAS